MPSVEHVRHTAISACGCPHGWQIVVFGAIGNMVKGASGSAREVMNLMFNQDPSAGLL